MRSLVLTERIGAGTMMWRDGMDGCVVLKDIPELFELLPKAAPVPPPIPAAVPPPLPDVEPAKTENDDFLSGLAAPREAEVGYHAQGGPWSRYFARQFDLTIWAAIFSIPLAYALPAISLPAAIEFYKDSNRFGQGLAFLAGAFVINVIVLALFGNSPGKAMFGLKAVPIRDDGRPPLSWRISREANVWASGMGFGLPLIGWFLAYRNYGEVKMGRPARYDRGVARMSVSPISGGRRSAAMLFSIIVVFGLLFLFTWMRVNDTNGPFAWVNPVTGISTNIPSGYAYSVTKADDGSTIYNFFDSNSGLQVLFASENAVAQLPTLQVYADAVKTNIAGSLALSAFTTVSTGVIQADGKSVDGSYNATFLVRHIGNLYWRVFLLDLTPTRNTVGVYVPPIVDALWRSAGS